MSAKHTSISEAWDEFAQDNIPIDAPTDDVVKARHAFYAGALASIAVRDRTSREAVVSECVQFGRVIGTPAQRVR